MNDIPEPATAALDCPTCRRRTVVSYVPVGFGPPHYCPWCREETYSYRLLDPEYVELGLALRDYLKASIRYGRPS